MSKHILFVLDYFLPHKWWVETVFDNITKRLELNGHKITILTTKYSIKLANYEKNWNIEIYRVWSSRINFMWHGFWKWVKILKKNRHIDVIHSSTYGWAIPASLLAKIFKKKVILTVHEIFGKLWNVYKWPVKWFFYLFFEKIIFSLQFNVYHCVSRYTMNSLRIAYNIPDIKMKVIWNGVDTVFWDKKNIDDEDILNRKKKYWFKNRFVLLYSWHSGKSKGLEFLIKAIPELVKQNDDILVVFNLIHAKRDSATRHLILTLEDIVKRRTNSKKQYIKILNWFNKEDLRILVGSCDLAVAPSLSEWFGSVHTETVALGKPLITTFIWPLPEVLWWEVEFIPPQNPEAIVNAVQKFRENWFKVIAKKNFDRDKTINEIQKLY